MNILVYGWYHQLNVGDELFISAFKKLFPNYNFVFHDHIDKESLQDVDAVFFGGGSFLSQAPSLTKEALNRLKNMPIFYLGVGVESNIHAVHMDLMGRAKMIATRSPDQVDRLKELNRNVMWIPDLVYSLQSGVKISKKTSRSVLVMPNISVVPKHDDSHWRHTSWQHFKTEFAQFLDGLVEGGYNLTFMSMCQGVKDNDDWAAAELVAHMSNRGSYILRAQPVGIEAVTSLVSKHSILITQRFHGIVLAEMTKTPYVAIHHHDKLKYSKPGNGCFVPYYDSSKNTYSHAFNQSQKMNFGDALPIEENIFEAFSQKITELVENGSLCRNQTQ